MNIDKTPIPGFKAVAFFRQVKEKLSREMEGKTFAERKALLQPDCGPNTRDRAVETTAISERT